MCTHPPSFLNLICTTSIPPHQVITDHHAELPVLFRSSPLDIYLHLVVNTCQSYTLYLSHHPLPPCVDMSVFCVCVSISALQTGSSVWSFYIAYICINMRYLFSLSDVLHSMIDSRFTQITTDGPVLFLFMAEYYSAVCMYHIFIHSSLVCFHSLGHGYCK